MQFIDDFTKFVQSRLALYTSKFTLDGVSISAAGPELEFRFDVERNAAWNIYIELATRITGRRLHGDAGLLRDALSSLHAIFGVVRAELKAAGPKAGQGQESLAAYSVRLLNEVLGPFLSKWHARLGDWEHQRPPDRGPAEHEQLWPEATAMRNELVECRNVVGEYIQALGKLAGVIE